jgi:hypothetical protein
MRLTLIALLLLALPAFAGEQSVSAQLYLEELQYEIEMIHVKRSLGQSTDYDEFMLTKMCQRLNAMTSQYIPRSLFTPAVINREPSQAVNSAPQNANVFYFTELINMKNAFVEHVYIIEGNVVHRQPFEVGGNRWRVWSSVNTRNASHMHVLVYANGALVNSKELSVQ